MQVPLMQSASNRSTRRALSATRGGALGLAGVRSALRRYAGGGTCLARLDDRPRGARKAGRERRPQL